ncbi:signal-transducing adaptor protein 1-like isoform X1 [Anguilla rostrata]|uniref:signal-transducing adaptor protein 1-like isoform X1 n=1 Tax=Anguilla rostrata TaxID=7938 RepID=UPI0030CFFE78
MEAISPVSRFVIKRREKITALPLYYSGYLLKKYIGEKDFKRFFGEIRGSTIFLYADDTLDTYSERVELQNLLAMDTTKTKTNLTIFTLTLLHEEIQLKIDNPDTAEEWRGFIMTVAKLEIPRSLQLLPGQMLRLEEVLEKERQRTAPSLQPITSDPSCLQHCLRPHAPSGSTETYDDVVTAFPPCFFSVSRHEAEDMLAQNPKNGNIILRPSNDNVNYAITVMQAFNSGPVMKHYKVRSEKSGYVIELDEPVTVPSLNDVIDHFVKIASLYLRPYSQAEDYDTRIEVPFNSPVSQLRPPMARVAPRICTQLAPPATTSRPLPKKPLEEENEYLDPDILEKDSGVLDEKLPQTGQRNHRQAAGWERKEFFKTTHF